MVNFIIIAAYLVMLFMPIFLMMVMEQYAEDKWDEDRKKRLIGSLKNLHIRFRNQKDF